MVHIVWYTIAPHQIKQQASNDWQFPVARLLFLLCAVSSKIIGLLRYICLSFSTTHQLLQLRDASQDCNSNMFHDVPNCLWCWGQYCSGGTKAVSAIASWKKGCPLWVSTTDPSPTKSSCLKFLLRCLWHDKSPSYKPFRVILGILWYLCHKHVPLFNSLGGMFSSKLNDRHKYQWNQTSLNMARKLISSLNVSKLFLPCRLDMPTRYDDATSRETHMIGRRRPNENDWNVFICKPFTECL